MFDSWVMSQQNRICFVMVDGTGTEVAGLGNAFTLLISKNGGAFAASAGTKTEIGSGWYSYLSTALEANTVGPIAIIVTGAGCVQQNLEYVVERRPGTAKNWPYTVTTPGGVPIEGVQVWFYTDAAATANLVWYGVTDALGVVRDTFNNSPWLDIGTYYVRRQKSGVSFNDPDTEVVT